MQANAGTPMCQSKGRTPEYANPGPTDRLRTNLNSAKAHGEVHAHANKVHNKAEELWSDQQLEGAPYSLDDGCWLSTDHFLSWHWSQCQEAEDTTAGNDYKDSDIDMPDILRDIKVSSEL